MKRLSRLFVVAITAALLLTPGGCQGGSTDPGDPSHRELTSQELQVASAANEFGFALFREVSASSPGENVFISPLSVSFALGMTFNGAAGSTEAAMRQTLGLDTLSLQEVNDAYRGLMDVLTSLDPDVQMEIANSIWYRKGFSVEPAFVDRNETYFDAEVTDLDFAAPDAAQTVNDWVSDKTHDKITEIVDDPIGSQIVMLLINAVYFKGTWTTEFDPADTVDELFTTAGGGTVLVPMMNLHSDLLALDAQDFQMVDLPYGNGAFRMAVLLPRPGVDVDTVLSQIDSASWTTWMAQLTEQEVELDLPRFELEYEKSLVDVLDTLGMSVAFQPGEADFSGINADADLFISDVKHKTYVKVDEVGTEAAAVTSVEIGVTSVPQIFTMRVDHPFIIVIYEAQSQSMLFMGKIGDPS